MSQARAKQAKQRPDIYREREKVEARALREDCRRWFLSLGNGKYWRVRKKTN